MEQDEVVFSEKYLPLFYLLDAKGEVEAKNNDPYYKNLANVDTVLISGGRDSGKTFGLGCFVGVGASDYNHRILYTRQTMTSTANSIVKALNNRLELLGLDTDFVFANNEYTSKTSEGCISITGQKTSTGTDTAKLKSIENYSIFVTDEGEELTDFENWKKIKRSIRAQDVQCLSIISFNPPSKAHFLYKEFYTKVPEGFNGIVDNVMYIHTTYLDNGQENMAAHNWNEYESLRKAYEYYLATHVEDRELLPREIFRMYREYKTTILGGFRDVAEGVIFEYTVGEYVAPEYGEVIGADQGFTHPSTFIKVNVDQDKKKIYLKEIFYKTHATEDEIYEEIRYKVGNSRIWCDSAAPLFIRNLKNRGLLIKPCKKPKIKDSIITLLNYELIVDPDSKNLQLELNNYRWNDKKKEEPIDDFNHAIDAFRYAATMKLKERVAQSV
jgi:phage terminase large subunit